MARDAVTDPDSTPAPGSARVTRLGRALLLLGGLAVLFTWAPSLSLPFTGEDYVLLARARLGEAPYPHVFRPLAALLLRVLHALFGVGDAAPYHALQLGLHLLNGLLVFFLARCLSGSRGTAGIAALLFLLCGAAVDAVVWIAAVNRPLGTAGTLLALLGLELGRRDARALALLPLGFAIAFLASEEVFGTGLILAGLVLGPRSPIPRARTRAACVLAVAAALAAHVWILSPNPELAARTAPASLAQITAALDSAATRAAAIAAGLGLPRGSGVALPLAGLVLLFLRKRAVAWPLAVFWLGSFVPFALSAPNDYRYYASLAPTALILALGAATLGASLPRRATLALGALLLAAVFLASHATRTARLGRWRLALLELETCARDARELARELEAPPALANLELSSIGPFVYFFEVEDPTTIVQIGFLDAASGYESPGLLPPGPWYGRRFDASQGVIDGEAYLRDRPVVPALHLYSEVRPVDSLAAAREALATGAVDVTRTALVETPRGLELSVPAAGGSAPGTVTVLEPFEYDLRSARMAVEVELSRPAWFVYQEHWLFEALYRVSPDQAVLTDQTEPRRAAMRARDRATGRELDVLPANGLGFGIRLDAGVHELGLKWGVRHGE